MLAEIKRVARFLGAALGVLGVVGGLPSPPSAAAQLSGKSVSEDAGPVSDGSRSVSHGSRPVHERGRSTHESSVGALSGNSTRESGVGSMKSGTLSEISAGTVTSNRSLRREKAQARLAPAPPRIVWDETVELPVEWQPVYELDTLIEEISVIQPMARVEMQPEVDDSDSIDTLEGVEAVDDSDSPAAD